MNLFTYRLERRGTQLAETWPQSCPNGHELGAGRMIIGFNPAPDGTRRRSWECRQCGVKTWGERG